MGAEVEVTVRGPLSTQAAASLNPLDREQLLPMGWAGIYLEGM